MQISWRHTLNNCGCKTMSFIPNTLLTPSKPIDIPRTSSMKKPCDASDASVVTEPIFISTGGNVSHLCVHWGNDFANDQSDVKIIQVFGEDECIWLVYGFPFVVDAYRTNVLTHPNLVFAGESSTKSLEIIRVLPIPQHDCDNLHIPERHLIVLKTTCPDMRHGWFETFGHLSGDAWQSLLDQTLPVGTKLRHLEQYCLKQIKDLEEDMLTLYQDPYLNLSVWGWKRHHNDTSVSYEPIITDGRHDYDSRIRVIIAEKTLIQLKQSLVDAYKTNDSSQIHNAWESLADSAFIPNPGTSSTSCTSNSLTIINRYMADEDDWPYTVCRQDFCGCDRAICEQGACKSSDYVCSHNHGKMWNMTYLEEDSLHFKYIGLYTQY